MCVLDFSLNKPIDLLQNRRISKIVQNSEKINLKNVIYPYMLYALYKYDNLFLKTHFLQKVVR